MHMTAERLPGPYEIGGLLFEAHMVARAVANWAMRPYGVELRDLGLLDYLTERQPRSQREMLEAVGVDKSTMVRVLDALEAQGLVERRPSDRDRRARAVSITTSGRERLRTAGDVAAGALEGLLSIFTEEERAQLAALLGRFVEHARGREPAARAVPRPFRSRTSPALCRAPEAAAPPRRRRPRSSPGRPTGPAADRGSGSPRGGS
jgi:DNA-binding MarR family transcriptional regulator